MAIVRWDPWRELAGFERQFDELFGRGRASSRGQGVATWVPALDVHQDGDTMVICAEIAGVDPGDVEITIDDNVLTMSGKREDDRKVEDGQWIRRERITGQFRRSISLPPGVDPDKVKATANNGVIEVRVPRPSQNEPHRVQLSSGNGRQPTEVDVESTSSRERGNGGSTPSTPERDNGGGSKSSTRGRSTKKTTTKATR
jgi:HSP20 family protein